MGKNETIRLENGFYFPRIQNRQRSLDAYKSRETHDEKSTINKPEISSVC